MLRKGGDSNVFLKGIRFPTAKNTNLGFRQSLLPANDAAQIEGLRSQNLRQVFKCEINMFLGTAVPALVRKIGQGELPWRAK